MNYEQLFAGHRDRVVQAGTMAMVPGASLLMGLPLGVIVEATGNPEAAAASGEAAIAGKSNSLLSGGGALVDAGCWRGNRCYRGHDRPASRFPSVAPARGARPRVYSLA